MNKQIFYMVLKENQISPNIVHFGGQKEGAFCIKKRHEKWETFYFERGNIFDVVIHSTEDEAMTYLLNYILKMYGKSPCGKTGDSTMCD